MVGDALKQLSLLVAVGMIEPIKSRSEVAEPHSQEQDDSVTMVTNRSSWQAEETHP